MRSALLVVAVLFAGCASAPQTTISGDAACAPSADNKAWLSRAPDVWPLVSRNVFGLKSAEQHVTYVLFDARCTFTSIDAHTWVSVAHGGKVVLPDGQELPAQVASFAAPASADAAMMVMALPSVWRADDVTSEMGLERLMFAVLAHEMTHTRQFGDYGPQLVELEAITGVGDEMTDDIIQDKFSSNAEFAAAVERERDLLFAAAAETDTAKARALAGDALVSMMARRTKWLSGDAAAFGELEDVFLTMEGAGQFAGFSWLTQPKGGGLDHAAALKGMKRGKRWSQDLGLALFMAIDRLTPAWPSEAFESPPRTALALLQAAVQGN